jgi:RHS repeat-associated protein
MGRITSVTAEARGAKKPTPVASKIAYQALGPPNALTFGNDVAEMRSFDLDYRMTAIADAGKAAVQGLTYAYDAANNVRSITDAVTSGNSQRLGYDVLDRLTSATGGYGSLGYSYDSNGNRLTDTRGGAATGTLAALDGLNSISGLAYNQAGRLATTNAGTKQITHYTYDAFGHRLVKVGSVTATTLFQYDQGGHLLEESDDQGSALVDYIYLEGRPVATFQPSDGRFYFLHDDRLGTPQMATDTAQAVAWPTTYQPFGQTSGSPALIVQDLRLPGQENDLETGLYHNGFRDYNPAFGRYLQSDPIGLGGGMNTYRYVMNNPVSNVDPMGLATYLVNRDIGTPVNEPLFDPFTHTFVLVTNPDGSIAYTYSWGANPNLEGWNVNLEIDLIAARWALSLNSVPWISSLGWLEQVGGDDLDPYVELAFSLLDNPQFAHGNLWVINNCKTEATNLIKAAQTLERFDNVSNLLGLPSISDLTSIP